MAYFQDVKILVYVKRGMYVASQLTRNEEKYGMLRILVGTAYRDFEPAVRKLSPHAKVIWHDEHYMLEVDMPTARWEQRYPEVSLINYTIRELENEHGYVWEFASADLEDHRKSVLSASKQVKVPLLRVKPIIEVLI